MPPIFRTRSSRTGLMSSPETFSSIGTQASIARRLPIDVDVSHPSIARLAAKSGRASAESLKRSKAGAPSFSSSDAGSSPSGRLTTYTSSRNRLKNASGRTAASLPALSASNARYTLSQKRLSRSKWYSVRAVPSVATTLLTPACAMERRSVYPSTTTASPACCMRSLDW